MSGRATWHWVCLEDEDLGFILDGPDPDTDLRDWVVEVIGLIEDGLESA